MCYFKSKESFLSSESSMQSSLKRTQIWCGHYQLKYYKALLRIMEIRYFEEYLTRKDRLYGRVLEDTLCDTLPHAKKCLSTGKQYGYNAGISVLVRSIL